MSSDNCAGGAFSCETSAGHRASPGARSRGWPDLHQGLLSRPPSGGGGVTAAATGAIAGAVVVLGRRAIVDVQTLGIALLTLLVLTQVRRVPEPLVIIGAGVAGFLLMRLR